MKSTTHKQLRFYLLVLFIWLREGGIMKRSNSKNKRDLTAFLYERLSRDDDLEGESYSIANQKKLLIKVAKEMGYTNLVHFCDDGISGVTMKRPAFCDMLQQLQDGKAAAVFVKDYCAIIGLNQKDLETQGILA